MHDSSRVRLHGVYVIKGPDHQGPDDACGDERSEDHVESGGPKWEPLQNVDGMLPDCVLARSNISRTEASVGPIVC